ncbi:cation diffusion facilitator family transporter [Novosphingobium sp. MW5]|nr:cation diffusion facilitator family transporter [Novosphingobium sp. MW5]
MGAHHHHSAADNGHEHGHHHHHHGHGSHGRAFALGVALNTIFVVVEAGYGLLSGSMALVADAGHNLTDVLGLLIAWAADSLSARPASDRFTYGYKSSSILAALANSALLMLTIGAIGAETVRRFFDPEPVAGQTMMVVAAIGIAINAFTALLFAKGSKHDINLRGAFLHMLGDTAVSAAVVVAGLLILWTGKIWIDTLTGLLIVAVIGWSTWDLAREALKMGLLGVPRGIDAAKVRALLSAQPGVRAVHDLHIWPMSTKETALTAHLVMPGGHPGDAFLHALSHELEHDFGIHHATLQVETADGPCHAARMHEAGHDHAD